MPVAATSATEAAHTSQARRSCRSRDLGRSRPQSADDVLCRLDVVAPTSDATASLPPPLLYSAQWMRDDANAQEASPKAGTARGGIAGIAGIQDPCQGADRFLELASAATGNAWRPQHTPEPLTSAPTPMPSCPAPALEPELPSLVRASTLARTALALLVLYFTATATWATLPRMAGRWTVVEEPVHVGRVAAEVRPHATGEHHSGLAAALPEESTEPGRDADSLAEARRRCALATREQEAAAADTWKAAKTAAASRTAAKASAGAAMAGYHHHHHHHHHHHYGRGGGARAGGGGRELDLVLAQSECKQLY